MRTGKGLGFMLRVRIRVSIRPATDAYQKCSGKLIDTAQLQNDLHNLYHRSCDWQMLFNVEKCKVLNFSYNNDDSKCTYTLGLNVIKAGDNQKDLGIIVHQSLKSTSQCIEAVKSANKTLGMINRTFMYKDKNTMLRLYKSLVRPKLEYCIQAWQPYLKKDIDLLENPCG